MSYESDVVNEARNSTKDHRLLEFAKKVCKDNYLAYNEKLGRLYRYSDGLYVPIKIGDAHARLDNIIINSDGGHRLSVADRINVIRNIQTLSYVDDSKFDIEYLNFTNTLFCVKTLRPIPHSPDIYSINRIPYAFEPMADCDLWKSFLHDIMGGDVSKISVLQEFIGYCFIRTCKFEKILVIPGGGQNGKGTFTNTILHLLGKENVSSATMANLSDDVARTTILNKYLNIDTDLSKTSSNFEEVIKKISSGEELQFNEKYIAPYSKAPFCKLIFAANDIPRIAETTHGFYRRLLIIPFSREITDEEKDVDLKEKLLKELPGIFHWAMSGLQRLIKNNKFSYNRDTVELVDELKLENNPILQFAEDYLTFKQSDEGTDKKVLYNLYMNWCKETSHKPYSMKKFSINFYETFNKKTQKDARRPNSNRRESYWPGVFTDSNLGLADHKPETFHDEN